MSLRFLIRLSFLLVPAMFCLLLPARAQRYPFYNLNIENGLIQSQAYALVQDRWGHLWIGTLGGLSRFDGKSFTSYTVRDGLPDNAIHALATHPDGSLWIGTTAGLSRFDGRSFRHFELRTKPLSGNVVVNNIQIAPDSSIWCLAGGFVFRISKNGLSPLALPPAMGRATAILPLKDTLLVAGSHDHIFRYTAGRWDSIAFPRNQGQQLPVTVMKLYCDRQHQVWMLSNQGLWRLKANRIERPTLGGQPLDMLPPLMGMTQDLQNHYWLTTYSGVYRLTDTSLQHFSKRNGLSDNGFNDALTDREGNVWLASDGQGIFRFSGGLFTVLDESMGLPSAQIMSLASIRGRLYLGTYDAGLYAYENGQIRQLPFPQKFIQPITAMAVRGGSELWMGTRGFGLWRYDGSSFRQEALPESSPAANFITALYQDPENRMWVGLFNGAMVYEQGRFRKLDMPGTIVRTFISIGPDSILIATKDGMMLHHAGRVQPFITGQAPDSVYIQCFTMRGRELWIGTSDYGLLCYQLDSHKTLAINKSNGLHSDFIYNLITDDRGRVWAGTGFGIHRISMDHGQVQVRFYGQGQGVSGLESNHNAVYKMEDGSIWFGTTNGAIHYQPHARMVQPVPVSIVLQSVRVSGESLQDTAMYEGSSAWYGVPHNLRLPYRKNNISFSFQAISLGGDAQLRYRYRVDGLEPGWSNWSATNTVTYPALPPGSYTLQVEATAGEGGRVSSLSYPFVVITPFHKTSLFRMIIIGGCILLGVSLQYMANRRKQNRIRMLEQLRREEQNKVRERTAEDFHDEVGNKLTRINVLTNVLKAKLAPLTPDATRIIDQIQDNTAQLYGGTRDILWSLKPSNDNLFEILHRIGHFGTELFQDTDIDFVFSGNDERWKAYHLPLDMSRNLIMIFKEALNNCLKYAGATRVAVSARLDAAQTLHMRLCDNGAGFDTEHVRKGHGIDNMHVRARRIHGALKLQSQPGHGTVIALSFKIPSMK